MTAAAASSVVTRRTCESLDRDGAAALEQLGERIAAPAFVERRDALAQLVEREVAGAIEQHRELVGRARARAGRGAAPAREHRLEHGERRRRRRPRAPINSSSSARSSDSSAARCSARGASSAYIQSMTNPNCSDAANGDGSCGLDGAHARSRPTARSSSTRASAGMSNASCSTSRYVSTRIGNDGNSCTACEQIERLESLQPERHAPARIAARQQQRARGVHAEARAEQRRRSHLVEHAPLGFAGA